MLSTRGVVAVAFSSIGLFACGHGEDQLQAELAHGAEVAHENDQNRQRVDILEAEIERLQRVKTDLETRVGDTERELKALRSSTAADQAALADFRGQLDLMDHTFEALRAVSSKVESLKSLGAEVTVRKNRLTLVVPGDLLFDPNRAELKGPGRRALLQIAEILRSDPRLSDRDFMVVGHTDDTPIEGGVFQDNTGLSLMKARQVVKLLTGGPKAGSGEAGGGLPVDHWLAAGSGETDPRVPNSTPENKAKNRRIEIVAVQSLMELGEVRKRADIQPAEPKDKDHGRESARDRVKNAGKK